VSEIDLPSRDRRERSLRRLFSTLLIYARSRRRAALPFNARR
jgi:hypothetical protein